MARKAYGSHRHMSCEIKARNIGESIHAREQEGRPWAFSEYGITDDSAQAALVRQWLAEHTKREVASDGH
ncbi:MAG TPA: hypothetical protein VF077_12310 [Nitrospiraceae bacterium]